MTDKITVTGPYLIENGRKWRVALKEGDCVEHFTFPNPNTGHADAVRKANELHDAAKTKTKGNT